MEENSTATGAHVSDEESDEFEVESEVIEDGLAILQRLKEFAYYLVENFEVNLNFCLSLLEGRPIPSRANSTPTNIISKLLSGIPKIGTAAGNAISKGEIVIFDKIDKKNSRILADLIYYYSDNKDKIRMFLIESAVDIFYSFEQQFKKLTCNGGPKRAMQKLAKDASDRIFNYFLETEQQKDITSTEITKGVLLGNSKRNQKGLREGKTVISDETKWKTGKIYRKTGIVLVEEQAFYKNKDTHTEKYGHRRMFPWEDIEDIRNNWEQDNGFEVPHYYLTVGGDFAKSIRDYIMTKNPYEEAKLERGNYNDEAAEDRKMKHEQILITFQEKFKELLEELECQYNIVTKNHNDNRKLLKEIAENQTKDKDLQIELNTMFQDMHATICETKILIETHNALQQESSPNTNNQDGNASLVTINSDELKEIVRVETITNMTEAVRETLRRNAPGPRIKKEVNRNIRKLKKIF